MLRLLLAMFCVVMISCAHGEKKRFGYGTIVHGMSTDQVLEQMYGRGPSEIRTSKDGVTVWKYRDRFCFGFKDGKLINKDEPKRVNAIDLFIFFNTAMITFPNCDPAEAAVVEKHTNVLIFFNFTDRLSKTES